MWARLHVVERGVVSLVVNGKNIAGYVVSPGDLVELSFKDPNPVVESKFESGKWWSGSKKPTSKAVGSSPALRIPCPVCRVPAGTYCQKVDGEIQVIAHKKRREAAVATSRAHVNGERR